jgi:hypothetical protein
MRIKSQRFLTKLIVIFYLSLILHPALLQALQPIHLSATAGYDLFNQYWPCYDITLLINNRWGIRYSEVTDVTFLTTLEEGQSVKHNEVRGDIQLPILIKTLDYTSFPEDGGKVFDFLTAYWGLGYNKFELTVVQREYHASSNSLGRVSREETVYSPVTALTFGLYGGDSFLVVDFRLLYLRGSIDSSDLADKTEFDKWLMLFSLGIAFY